MAINIAAFPALRRLTPLGREVRDQIEGFRQFLEKVEQDRLRRVDAADPHAAASEFLPYAIALEVREPGAITSPKPASSSPPRAKRSSRDSGCVLLSETE